MKTGKFNIPEGDPPEAPPKQLAKNISIGIELTGYEKFKTQLDDVESQFDRILKKARELDILKDRS